MANEKMNERQAAAWKKMGDLVLVMFERVTNLKVPDHVAIDRLWLYQMLEEMRAVTDEFIKEMPIVDKQNSAYKTRMRRLMEMLPEYLGEAMNANVRVRLDGIEVSHELPDDDDLN